MRNKRFPGARAFGPREQHLFHGRDTEVEQLLTQVRSKNLVVVFSEPGTGKSSLINAGLSPWLHMQGYQPVPVRVKDLTTSPVEATKEALEKYLDAHLLQTITGGTPNETGLWETLRSCQFQQFGSPTTPVLIFDQFEEFFEHAQSAQQEWGAELGDLIAGRLPCRVKDLLRDIAVDERTADLEDWCRPVDVRIVIVINSYQLGWLDDLKDEIPSILNHRYRLKPFTRAQAEEALTGPAGLASPDIDSPPFTFHESAIEVILLELADRRTGTMIDPFRLQLVCQRLEEGIASGQIPLRSQCLEAADFGSREGIRRMLDELLGTENIPTPGIPLAFFDRMAAMR